MTASVLPAKPPRTKTLIHALAAATGQHPAHRASRQSKQRPQPGQEEPTSAGSTYAQSHPPHTARQGHQDLSSRPQVRILLGAPCSGRHVMSQDIGVGAPAEPPGSTVPESMNCHSAETESGRSDRHPRSGCAARRLAIGESLGRAKQLGLVVGGQQKTNKLLHSICRDHARDGVCRSRVGLGLPRTRYQPIACAWHGWWNRQWSSHPA